MFIHKILDYPLIYNLAQKILSLIAFGNKGMEIFLKNELGSAEGTVLDIGCGTGRFAKIFGERYTGIDCNRQYIDYARQKNKGKFYVADAAKIDFLGQKYDYVLSICTFHHLSDAQSQETVKEMVKIANKEIYIIDPVYPSKLNIVGYLLFKLDRGKYRRTFVQFNNLLSSLGFDLIVSGLNRSFPYRICVFRYKKLQVFRGIL